jgi:hypothetical protein
MHDLCLHEQTSVAACLRSHVWCYICNCAIGRLTYAGPADGPDANRTVTCSDDEAPEVSGSTQVSRASVDI